MDSKKHIFLIGPSGVGKTDVGAKVADQLNLRFIDLDDEIVKTIGTTIHQYFTDNGEEAFREIESTVLKEIILSDDALVISPGAGCVLRSINVVAMKNSGIVIELTAQDKDIVHRVLNDTKHVRPLLADDVSALVAKQREIRGPIYALVGDISIGTTRRSVDEVTDAVIRQVQRSTGIKNDITNPISVGSGILTNIADSLMAYSSVFLVTQEGIPTKYKDTIEASLNAKGIKSNTIIIPEGEEGKTSSVYIDVLNQMAQLGASRSSCVIALGGGVVGDLSAYVGATFMRGIDVAQVPTTLLAQVDSSIGGKNGINLESGKNLVGTITQPKLIIADSDVLSTLSEEDYLSGLGEVVKYALLGNVTVWELIEEKSELILKRDPEVLAEMIRSCMNHKVHVVSRDPFERNGMRATLNLGHTLAHVIEKATDYKIAHGQAVAIGIRYICELSLELDLISVEQRDAYLKLLNDLNLGVNIPPEAKEVGAEQLVKWMLNDKKSDGTTLNFVLFQSEGGTKLINGVDTAIATKVLDNFLRQG